MTSNAFTPERIAKLREILAEARRSRDITGERPFIEHAAAVAAVNTLPAALDEIERLSAELSRAKAERDEAVRLLMEMNASVGPTEQCICALWLDIGMSVQRARSFLSRMEGRKDG